MRHVGRNIRQSCAPETSGTSAQTHTLSSSVYGTEFLHVEKVLISATGEFIANEVALGDDEGGNLAVDPAFKAMLPSFLESDAVHLLKNIDPLRRLAHLDDRAIPEIGWSQAVEWRAECGKRRKYGLAVFHHLRG